MSPFFIIMIKKIFQYFNLFINQSSILVGGQAVIEGVLMRVPGAYATAVRDSEGNILIDRHDFKSVLERYNLKNIIILSGVIGLFESLKIGFKTLQWSADIAQPNNNNGNPSSVAYLDYISLEGTCDLSYNGDQFIFYNKNLVDLLGIAEYNITNANSISNIWEITDLNNH